MEYMKPIYYSCHPTCVYRTEVKGKGIKCNNFSEEAEILPEKDIMCYAIGDYFEHMDTFHVVLQTEQGLIGLDIYSGEPLMVEPALNRYIAWLKGKYKSVTIFKEIINMEETDDEVVVTDSIYAEFILGWSESEKIKKQAYNSYPEFESTLPSDLKALSQEAILKKENYHKICSMNELSNKDATHLFMEIYDAQKKVINEAYWAFYRDHRISRIDFMHVRNRFGGWE